MVKKRSRSPEPALFLASVPSFTHENKRVKAENGSPRLQVPPPNKQLPPPNQQSPNKKGRSRGRNPKKYKKNQNYRPLYANKQNAKQSPRPNPPLGSNAGSPIVTRLGRQLETTSKKLQAQGYIFVPSGNVYITRHCKRLTLESGRTLWKVDHPKKKGIQVPLDVYKAVTDNERATRDMRKAAVDKVDKKEKDEARECLIKLFPNLPPGEDDVILGRAWERSSGRVGRTTKLSLEQKVRKAVIAHVRHAHSSYDQRLREEFVKNGRERVAENILQKVRNETWKEVNAVVNSWTQRGAARIVNSQNEAVGHIGGRRQKKKTAAQRQAKRERKAQRRMNETEEQKRARQERRDAKKRNRQEKKLLEREAKRAEQELQEKDTEIKANADAPEIIVIDSDSEDDISNDNSNNEDTVTENRNKKGIRVIDLQESDSEEEEEAENAEDWDIGEEDDDDDFFYAEDTDDEDYLDLENIDEYRGETRQTRLSARTVAIGENEGMEEDEDEDKNLENTQEDGEDADDAEEQMHREDEAAQAQVVRNEDEIELNFDDIESTYQDLRLFNSGSNAQTTQAEIAIQQAETERQREEDIPVVEQDGHLTVVSSESVTQTLQKHTYPQKYDPVPPHQREPQTKDNSEKDIDHKKEKRVKTEVEEAEEELYRDFGFDDEDENSYFDGFGDMEIELENNIVMEEEVEKVFETESDKAEEKQEEEPNQPETKPKEPEDKVEEETEDKLKESREAVSEVESEVEPEVEPEETTLEIKPEDESEEEFVKKEYQVGGYIVEEFVRVKRVKADVKKESVKRKRLEQASRSEKETKFKPGTSKETHAEAEVKTKVKYNLPVRNWSLPNRQN